MANKAANRIACFVWFEPDFLDPPSDQSSTRWAVTWAGPGDKPDDFVEHSFTAAIRKANHAVAALYADKPLAAMEGELQYVIYPRRQDASWRPGGTILEIKQGIGTLTARTAEGIDLALQGDSPDDLLAKAEAALPRDAQLVFVWRRRIVELS